MKKDYREETFEEFLIRVIEPQIEVLEETLKNLKPDVNDVSVTLDYDRRMTALKELKKLFKVVKNGK